MKRLPRGKLTISDLLGGNGDVEQMLQDLLVLNERGKIANIVVSWEEADGAIHCDAIATSYIVALGLCASAKFGIEAGKI